MSVYIVDSSVAVKWLIHEDHTEAALSLFVQGNELHAPDLIVLEVENVLCKRLRRGEIDLPYAHDARRCLREFPVHPHATIELLDPAFELAVSSGRALYDCVFLALAGLIGAVLVTADRRFYDSIAAGSLRSAICWVADVG